MKKTNFTFLKQKRSEGFSLLELLISMTLGIGLLGGLVSMYMGSTKTDKARSELSYIESNARFTLTSLRKRLEHAGYRSVHQSNLSKPFHTEGDGNIDNASCRDGGNMIISGVGTDAGLLNPPTELEDYTKDGTGSNSDRITVIYQADNPADGPVYTDCGTVLNYAGTAISGSPRAYSDGTSTRAADEARQVSCSADTTLESANGMLNASDSKIYNGFYVRQVTGGKKQLVCYGSRSSSTEPSVIAEDVDNMQIRYGVLIDDATRYLNATEVEAITDAWSAVVSIQVALLMSSDGHVIANPTARTYQLLDKTITKAATDTTLYKVYTTTISLPNRQQRDF